MRDVVLSRAATGFDGLSMRLGMHVGQHHAALLNLLYRPWGPALEGATKCEQDAPNAAVLLSSDAAALVNMGALPHGTFEIVPKEDGRVALEQMKT